MKIDLFAICYNEEIMLPYFLRHYSNFCNNITIYDNMSTDSSREIMKKYGVNVIEHNTNSESVESQRIKIRNNCWKKSDADWVIVCDVDEFVYHRNMLRILKLTKATRIQTKGYEMVSEKLPTTNGQIYDEIKYGTFKESYSKPCLFKPGDIIDINFGPGSHPGTSKNATGNVISIKDSGIKLLHYKYINRDVLIEKYAHYAKRLSRESIRKGYGDHRKWGPKILNRHFDDLLKTSKNVIDNDY